MLLMVGKHPKYAQELLAHATITLDTYSHVIEGLADAMDEALLVRSTPTH